MQLERPADGHVQLVDLALALGVLELPHPLLADDVDHRGVVRGAVGVEVDVAPQTNMTMKTNSGVSVQNSSSGTLPGIGAGRRRAGPAAVADGEVDQQHRHQQADAAADDDQEAEQLVHGLRRGRGLLGNQMISANIAHPAVGKAGAGPCRRSLQPQDAEQSMPTARTVSTPPSRTNS